MKSDLRIRSFLRNPLTRLLEKPLTKRLSRTKNKIAQANTRFGRLTKSRSDFGLQRTD